MKAIILNYLDGSVNVAELPAECELTEQIEDYLVGLGFSLDEINYMTVKGECPVYPCGKNECDTDFAPITIL